MVEVKKHFVPKQFAFQLQNSSVETCVVKKVEVENNNNNKKKDKTYNFNSKFHCESVLYFKDTLKVNYTKKDSSYNGYTNVTEASFDAYLKDVNELPISYGCNISNIQFVIPVSEICKAIAIVARQIKVYVYLQNFNFTTVILIILYLLL